MPYIGLQSIVENFNPPHMRNYWKSDYLAQLSDAAIDVLVDSYPSVPAPLSHVGIEHLGGALGRIGENDAAVSHRAAQYNVIIVGMWSEFGRDEQVTEWVRRLWEALRRFSFGGVYLNYLSNEGDERVRAAYSSGKYERLVAVKKQVRPHKLLPPQPERSANHLRTATKARYESH